MCVKADMDVFCFRVIIKGNALLINANDSEIWSILIFVGSYALRNQLCRPFDDGVSAYLPVSAASGSAKLIIENCFSVHWEELV